MKRISYSGLFIITLIIAVFSVVKISQWLKSESSENNQDNQELVTIGKAPYFSFINQNGETISNENYKGKIYLAEFFFTTCPTICPIMTRNMVKIQNTFKDNSIGIASFSINPTHDTPEILKKYAEDYGVTNPNWHLMTGNQEDILNLANRGFNLYAGTGSKDVGGFEHSGLFALIDKNGNIVSRKNKFGNPIVYYDGTSEEGIANLIDDIRILISSK